MRALHRGLLPLGLLVLVLVPAVAPALVPTSTDSAMGYLEVLADEDRFQGRKTGAETGNASQAWIADHFAVWGLQPFIGESLLHEFPMLVTEEKRAELTLLDSERHGDIDLLLGTDFTLTVNSGSGKVTAPVVFVGHGISKPDKGWDDYGDHDVSGKIVVILRGRPSNGENWDDEYSRSYLLPTAIDHGAAAVLFHMGEDVIGGAAIMEKAYDPDIPSAVIGDRVVDLLLHGTGFPLDVYRRVLKHGPRVLEVGKRMRIKADVDRIEPGLGYNVVGLVPGTDPDLANEVVLIGGHGDHVGTNSLGHVYPGADDNGSGTCVVMELARNFVNHPQPRPIVFMLFGAEEQGLLGSEAVVPDLPDGFDYITMVNLDMAGRGEGITGIGGGNAIPEAWFPFYNNLPDSVASTIQQRRAWGGYSSDHAPFREAGIPAFTSYSRGSHDHYHRTDDTFATIDTRAIGGSLDALSHWLEALASHPEPLAHPYQAERVVWHRGTAFTHAELSGEIEADLDWAAERNVDGFVTTVLSTPAPESDAERDLFSELLDRYSDALSRRDDLSLGDELKAFRGNANNLRGTVFLAAEGDSFTDADSTRMIEWNALGLHWVRLHTLLKWVDQDSIHRGKQVIAATWKDLDTVVEMPLDHAHSWLPLARAVARSLFVGSWEQWEALTPTHRDELTASGAHVLLHVPHADLAAAVADVDALSDHKVHVQPVGDDYSEALSWVRLALEQGLEKDDLLEWIGGHAGRW